jgi:two-component system nitrogen regulation sensor histidine kinase NtrY
VRLEPGAEQVGIAVEDDGIGLPGGEERERLTEPYVTHKLKGTGLGLAIVKKIMEDHGGRLVIEDRAGQAPPPGLRAPMAGADSAGAWFPREPDSADAANAAPGAGAAAGAGPGAGAGAGARAVLILPWRQAASGPAPETRSGQDAGARRAHGA